MARWSPDARRRLQDAALDLCEELGYATVTVADVAERAGLTTRTFYRYFADKKEILFGDNEALRATLVEAVGGAAQDHTPLDAAREGLLALSQALEARRDRIGRRQRILAQAPELRELELAKVAGWTTALHEALTERGAQDQEAHYIAAIAMAIFTVAFVRWAGSVAAGLGPGAGATKTTTEAAPLADRIRGGFDQLRGIAAS